MSWTQSSAPTTNEIWRSQNGGAFALLSSQAGALTTFTDPTVYGGNTLIEYKVRAVAPSGTSNFSVTRGALRAQDDSFSGAVAISYPTVQVVITSYTMDGNAPTLSLSFPELLYGINPPFCIFDLIGNGSFNSLSMPKVIKVGAILANGNGALVGAISFPALVRIDDSLSFNAAPIASLSAPVLAFVGGFMDFTSVAFSGPVFMPSLQTVQSDLVFSGSSGETAITLTSLQTVGGSLGFGFGGPTTFTSLSLPALTSVTNALVLDNASLCVSLTANALTTITNGVCQINNNAALQTVSMNACTDVGGFCEFTNNPNLTTISMSSLVNVGDITADDLALTTLPALTSINFNSLVHVNQTLGIVGCTSLTTISLPALNNIGEDININNNTALTSISLPVFVSQNGNVNCGGNANLSSFNAPNIIITDGASVIFANCALNHTSIEQVLRRGVISGVTTSDFQFQGGTNAGLSTLSAQGQADYATLAGLGNTMNSNP